MFIIYVYGPWLPCWITKGYTNRHLYIYIYMYTHYTIGTLPYKAICWRYIPLHSPYVDLVYGRYLQ